jgi:predicted N-formylglutamate amidohydrolase
MKEDERAQPTRAGSGLARTLVVTAEHASRDVPSGIDLGVDETVLDSHVAWDPGAREVAIALASALGAPLFLGEYTRLVADLNRPPHSIEAVPARAFGVLVPGNASLSEQAIAERLSRHHAPYWRKVEGEVGARIGRGEDVLHISVHSFTPNLNGAPRTVELGVLFDPERPREQAVAEVMGAKLEQHGFDARPNEPYDGRSDALTTSLRGRWPIGRYVGIEIEINQALIGGLERVSRAVEEAVRAALAISDGIR